MITKIRYRNFKALQDTTLPLGRFTLIVGANGTGKSTALKGFEMLAKPNTVTWKDIVSVGNKPEKVEISLFENNVLYLNEVWVKNEDVSNHDEEVSEREMIDNELDKKLTKIFTEDLRRSTVFKFEPTVISKPVVVKSDIKLEQDGGNLAGVLDLLRDSAPEKYEELNRELSKWFPEFDRILFEVPGEGKKTFLFRTASKKHKIKAKDLSDGTLLALAYLTIAYLPKPPKIVAFEEPEQGVHPRLLHRIQEAMYRLAYPESFGEDREAVQVIATTHSPYLLDLYKDHPEEIVISSKDKDGVKFERLTDKPHYEDILKDGPLGEIWYSGVLGGVPSHV